MAGTLIASEFTYTSGIPRQQYRFTITVDQTGIAKVRDVNSPFGLIMDSWTSVPQSVVDDINSAIAQVQGILSVTTTINGTLVWSAETEKAVLFTNPLASTGYRVHLAKDEFIDLRITNKTTTGFTIQAAATYTGTVGYDVHI